MRVSFKRRECFESSFICTAMNNIETEFNCEIRVQNSDFMMIYLIHSQ